MAAVSVSEARLRRKQLLNAEEAELFELAQAAGSGLDPEVFRVLLDLLRMNVAPLAVFQVLKSMCAGQRLPPGPEGGPAATAPLPADTRAQVIQDDDFQTMPLETPECGAAVGVVEVALIMIAKMSLFILIACM
ncbi:mitotic-spindle organizing protein 2B-like [Pitangus sulphuratus]|nr:mitotic-spindle organizing protein 2B-like [Pitangus sulphuratus]